MFRKIGLNFNIIGLMASTQHGNTLIIENTGSTSWKLLRSSTGLARDDDDENSIRLKANDNIW